MSEMLILLHAGHSDRVALVHAADCQATLTANEALGTARLDLTANTNTKPVRKSTLSNSVGWSQSSCFDIMPAGSHWWANTNVLVCFAPSSQL